MLFVEEQGRKSRIFDFSAFPVSVELQQWMARCFARTTGPRGGAKRLNSASDYYKTLAKLAAVLSEVDNPPRSPQEVTPAHIAAFRLALTSASHNHKIVTLRVLIRKNSELRPETRRAILEGRLPQQKPAEILAYNDGELRQILVTVRGDIRKARDRIHAGRSLLAAFRRGELTPGSRDEQVAQVLDVLEATGDFPRFPGGRVKPVVKRLGGVGELGAMLSPTLADAVAFALLLVEMTAENFGTVAGWPAVHFRPDGGLGNLAVALLEESKPRRGPSREHMVTAVEDLPEGLADVIDDVTVQERRLFRSPLLVYLLLLDLGALARRHSGSEQAFCYVSVGKSRRWGSELSANSVGDWAESRGFPRPPAIGRHRPAPDQEQADQEASAAGISATPGEAITGDGKPYILVQRLRQTAIERRRHPVAHTRSTMNDHYLRRSPQVIKQSGEIVRDALDAEVTKARDVQAVPVFTADFLARAAKDPQAAAAEMGVDADTLKRMLNRERDTVLAACVDHHDSPHAQPGDPCDASFLLCLRCRNARALPHHLPVQVAVHDRLAALRSDLPPQLWLHRYGDPYTRLGYLLSHHPDRDRDQARDQLTESDRQLADDLVNGRLDLR
ncbi:hypothetical protein EJK15_65890 [Nonomuraea basaltis]|nr:hypothetical protein EJK15_65890 [Nonomuraea basaltis]